MANSILLLVFFSMLLLAFAAPAANAASDLLSYGRNITDGDTLVSAGGSFTLGFFSPAGVPSKRYLGVWFSVSEEAVYWVANRDRPLTDASGVLVITGAGSLRLLDGSGQVVWSSNTTAGGATGSASARLLESGNLVVLSDSSSSGVLWPCFDIPSNTLLPGMKIGKNLWTGGEWYLTSWSSSSDPTPGRYRYMTSTRGVPENVLWDGDVEKYRTGPWNGLWFSGIPEMLTYSDMFTYELTISPGEITFGYVGKAGAPLSRLLLTDDGVVQRLVWDASSRGWKNFFQGPRDVCDAYGKCGAFGVCDAGAASSSFCGCATGFSPASPEEWRMRDASGGCHRNVALDCAGNGTTTDGFLHLRGVKLPDTNNASVNAGITLEECGARCLANCSCVAYAPADIRGGDTGTGSGCIMWTDRLVDLRSVDGGQDIYVRSAQSELGEVKSSHHPFLAGPVIGGSLASLFGIVLFILSVLFVIRRCDRRRNKISAAHSNSIQSIAAPSVPPVELSSLKEVTGNFSAENIIGKGGFGIVYKGHLFDGTIVAVKRLSIQSLLTDKDSKAFMREVEVMSKLRHGNLVQLLSYCKDGDEHLLVYEYMENKSLDFYIFGHPESRAQLNWEQRLVIIRGTADGVAYLHSGLITEEVVHRDLKPGNILLDKNWRPKISDFGTAKLYVEDQTADQTCFMSAGYVAPEYAMQGYLTLKCDVYSFGVIILEIVGGKRNKDTPTLLSDAWEAWKHNKIKDLLDPDMKKPEPGLLLKLEKCVEIALLCVQPAPNDRPTMSAIVTMLNSSNSEICPPKMPKFDGTAGSPLRDADFSTQQPSSSGTHSFTV